MQRHRFFAPASRLQESTITLAPDESHHLARVLRLTPGEIVYAFDGEGTEYECVISRVSKDLVTLAVNSRLSNEVESPLEVTLGQALVKGEKFDWIVQKATELGVRRIIPLITRHSELRKAEGQEQRLQRWRRIALEATKQCGRRRLTEIGEIQSFDSFGAQIDSSAIPCLFFSEKGGKRLSELPAVTNSITLTIGPEGGWSEDEATSAEKAGFIPIHLGPRILRAETAAISAISLVQYLFGDLRA